MAMVEVRLGHQVIELPQLLRIEGVSEALYDALTELEEDVKAELIDGVMIVHSPEKTRHEDVFGFMFPMMRIFAIQTKQAKVLGSMATVHLGTCRKVKPDIVAVREERKHIVTEDAIEGTPDLVVEIVSHSTRRYDFGEKRKVYEEAGVPEIWLVDFERKQVTVVRKVGQKYRSETKSKGVVRSQVLKGFWLQVDWLWQEELPDPMECLQVIR
ncbi:Uma2 family endonuclease [Fervidibacter sacchari]|uniref:Uma2 family endonuclease n=1 Tax=Candidatus Fervidibacter sacchari TaxID=1448929 RepID=A0ABT2EKH2_9BACT|nr:Uma2 family endonuclease [Candidatus Fervidibacter sacchari]MCS3918452.1 Uma2 family endonuclease [Candidatus Fervidibacter sacchari]WKU16232.1 Uma2 family endonuclease [Candidatus Fervidibacter sacchari]